MGEHDQWPAVWCTCSIGHCRDKSLYPFVNFVDEDPLTYWLVARRTWKQRGISLTSAVGSTMCASLPPRVCGSAAECLVVLCFM